MYTSIHSFASKKSAKSSFLDVLNSSFEVFELCFDCARGMFRPCSRYVSTVVDCTRPCRHCSRYVSTVLEERFDRARAMFRLCSRNVAIVLEECFDRARGMFRPWLTVLDRADIARGVFRPCSRNVLTVLEVCFDRARGMFRPCSTVLDRADCARGMFRNKVSTSTRGVAVRCDHLPL